MKQFLYLILTGFLVLSCSKGDNDDNSSSLAEEPRMENSAITNIFATGTVAEQTPEEAKKTIFGKWKFGSNSSSGKSALKSSCYIESLEFTDDSFLVLLSDSQSQINHIYGTYGFEEKDNKVVSVKLNTHLDGVETNIAAITDIVVVETNGVIDIDFTINILIDLNKYNIPCENSLNKSYSGEKDEPLEGTLEADKDSTHYKLVGKYLAASYSDNYGWDLNRLFQNECYENGGMIENCEPTDAIQLEITTYGTFLYMELTKNTPHYIEGGKWKIMEDEKSVIITGTDGDFLATISDLSETGFKMFMSDSVDGETYTWSKQ